MIHHCKNGIDYFEFSSFATDNRLTHAVFGRNGGVSAASLTSLNLSLAVGDDPENVIENQRRAFGLFGRSRDTLVHAHLDHGDAVARVTRADHGSLPQARVDALITADPGCGLTMNFADCTPIFLHDPVRQVIGLGHAGWKGALADLPGAMVRAMQAEFGCDSADMRAGIGPTISVTRYEVDEPVISAVHNAFPDDADELLVYPEQTTITGKRNSQRRQRPHFDLERANLLNLKRAGVQHVELSGLCTATHTDTFYSHRAERGETGRFGTIFVLQAR
ncbi:MAG: polyphenol oxidase family protein [Anaerolineae bacterium]|nr:polyphenol oxidase family protein [Anaerolineae bacterium]